jgi:hypothetical protein
MFMKFDLDLPSIDDFDVTSRHALGRRIDVDVVDVVDTSSRHEHLVPIDLRHRKQMGNKMLIRL